MTDTKTLKSVFTKILVEFSRIILGVTFMFSGFVKAVDPWGTAYKIEDYLGAFNLSTLSFLSFPTSVFLCILEFLLGAFILFGLYRFWSSRLILLVMCFMTPLTLYLAIADPVQDCGCFGDALIISNWETFYKNVVLIICAIITFKYYKRISNIFTGQTYWIAFLFIIVFSLGFVMRNYIYEPIFDFRPYSVGIHLPSKMLVPEGKEQIEETVLIYEKDGIQQEFSQDNFPWEDSTWVFVDQQTKIIKKGEDPAIKDFTLTSLDFNNARTEIIGSKDITEEVLNDSNYTFLMISPDLNNVNIDYLSSLEDVAYYTIEHDYKFYCLTSSVEDDVLKFIADNSINFEFATVDERVLKTITRTNPGLILLKDGVVLSKWADIDVPSEEDLKGPVDQAEEGAIVCAKNKDKETLIYISLIFFIPLMLLKLFDFSVYRKKKKIAQEDMK